MKTISPSLSPSRRVSASRRWLAVWCLLAVSFALTASPALAGSYAAIAFDEDNGRYGYGKAYKTRAAAEEKALEECGGRHAKIVMWAHEGVIALAIGDRRGSWGTGRDNRRKAAQNQAVDNCNEHTENAHVVITIDTEE